MSNRRPPKHRVDKRAATHGRRPSLPKLAAWGVVFVAAIALAVTLILVVFGATIVDGYGRRKAERAFARTHPGSALRIGRLEYLASVNCLTAHAVTLTAPHTALTADRITLKGVRWARLLWGAAPPDEVLGQTRLEVTGLNAEFPQVNYELRCARLLVSTPESELVAEGTELRPLGGDEAFFAAHVFQTPRFRVVVPECRVSGLAYAELLQGKSYRAGSVHFSRPSFEALVNRDKPPKPFVKSPLMVHEALATIQRPLVVGHLSITNGTFRYCERLAVGADPAVVNFGAVSLFIEGIANRGDPAASIQLRGQGDLMDAGTMKVRMTIPLTSPDFSLHYSGSLSAMDLTRLDAFLEIAEHTRIKSGIAQEAAFEVDVVAGHARGRVRAIYRDLEIAVLGKQSGNETGLGNRITSFLANVLKVRNANTPEAPGSWKEGEVDYTRQPDEPFQQFVWFALRTGVTDIISH